ncbi:hypothetical protein LINPERHAP1_LOCUS15414 [Linum perenne]
MTIILSSLSGIHPSMKMNRLSQFLRG